MTTDPARAFLDALDALLAKAMPRPWTANGSFLIGDILPAGEEEAGEGLEVAYVSESADTTLIAAAVNALPALTAALRAVLNLADAWQELEPGVDPEEALLDQVGADIWAAVTAALTPKPTP